MMSKMQRSIHLFHCLSNCFVQGGICMLLAWMYLHQTNPERSWI
jgi:hypothetical protein